MKIKENINNYFNDTEYKIIIKKDMINIANYDQIIDFNNQKISIKHQNKLIIIEGLNLSINKMMDNEIIINGNINNIRIN